MADPHRVYRPILDLIGKAEGTAVGSHPKAEGYDTTLNYGAYTGGSVPLTSLTLAEIDELQTQMLNHPQNTWNSSALGMYQIVRTTLRPIVGAYKWDRNKRKFDGDTQDLCARFLLYRRGIDDYCKHLIPENKMLLELAREWASFPMANGEGYYSGQGGKLPPDEVIAALREVRRLYNADDKADDTAIPSDLPTDPEVRSCVLQFLKCLFG